MNDMVNNTMPAAHGPGTMPLGRTGIEITRVGLRRLGDRRR